MSAGFELIRNAHKYEPTLYDLKNYFYNVEKRPEGGKLEFAPVIGEDSNCIVATLAFLVEKMPVLIQGYAGSGKTQIMEAVAQLIGMERKVTLKVSSKKAPWYMMDEINKKEFVIISEYQKVTGDFIEILKDWGERRQAQYDVTDITKNKEGDQIRSIVLPYKPFITSKAYENKDAEVTEELGRRVIQLFTTSSVPMNERILKYKLECKAKKTKSMRTMERRDIELLKLHLGTCIDIPDNLSVINPCAPAMLEYIPKTFRISCSLVNYYLQIVDSIAKFYHKKRMVVDSEGNEIPHDMMKTFEGQMYLLATPEDNFLAWAVYGQQFIESCLEMNLVGRQIVTAFPKIKVEERLGGSYEPRLEDTVTETELVEKMRSAGVILKRKEIREKLNELLITGYIDMYEGASDRKKRYYKTQMAAHLLDKEEAVDWKGLRDMAIKMVGSEFGGATAEYKKRFCGDDIKTTHPFTGKSVKIMKVPRGAKVRKISDDDEAIKSILGEMEGGEKSEKNTTQRTFDIN